VSIEQYAAKLVPFDFDELAGELADESHPLHPIYNTGGLLLPITPNITESTNINYDSVEIPHTNEAFNVYRGTSNREISLGNVIFPCDTSENARYGLAAIHFFRTYSLMDFGVSRSGRPPSPMFFSAFGKYMFDSVPVLLKGYSMNLSDMEIDQIPATNPDGDDFSWLPVKLNIGDLQLTVQHSPNYWRGVDGGFSLQDFRNGSLVNRQRSSGV
jgi:hypothetical protein